MSYASIHDYSPAEVIFRRNLTTGKKLLKALTAKKSAAQSTEDLKNEFPIKGQGVLLFQFVNKTDPYCAATLHLSSEKSSDGLKLQISHRLELFRVENNTEKSICSFDAGTLDDKYAFYWVSLDTNNMALFFGVGESRLETASFFVCLADEKTKKANWGDKEDMLSKIGYNIVPQHTEKIKDLLKEISRFELNSEYEPMRVLRDPIVERVAMIVKDKDELTMEDIAMTRYMPKANLNPIGQKLYDNVAGEKFILDTPDFPYFSAAIERSIADVNGWCYQKLVEKTKSHKEQYPKDKQAYLRITLGKNSGESPGVPYVFEIWPPGCYSSYHNHAGANALIRVLSGQVNVTLNPYLGSKKGILSRDFVKDEITWISPTLNQFHILKNENIATCITIQCYMYDSNDIGHYAKFDYIDQDGNIQGFEPNSDMDFMAFKNIMKEEWVKAGGKIN